jgi:site-specific recombinase XerD
MRHQIRVYLDDASARGVTSRYLADTSRTLLRFRALCREREIHSVSRVDAELVQAFLAGYERMSASHQRTTAPQIRMFLDFHENYCMRRMRIRVRGTSRVHVDWLTLEETREVFKAPMTPRQSFMIGAGFLQGLRRIEMLRMTQHDAEEALETGILRVRGKGFKERGIPLHDHFGEVLTQFLSTLEPGDKHRRLLGIQRTALDQTLQAFSKICGRSFSFHTMRRSFGRNLWLQGVKLETISELLGHSKIPLTEDEVSRVLEEARRPRRGRKGFRNNSDMSLRDHAAICVMYYGGLRATEVINLRKSDLDLDNRKLRVNQGKGMDFSPVNLPDEAVKGIRNYLEHGRPMPATREHADHVFLSSAGRPIDRTDLCALVKRIAFRAGIEKNVHPHIFRHSMITHMAEKGLSASFIQAQSRHKSLDMVQRYTHLSEKSVRDAYDSVFSRREATNGSAPEKSAQKEEVRSETSENRRDRALELFLDGKISNGELEQILTRMNGQQYERSGTQPMNGYA